MLVLGMVGCDDLEIICAHEVALVTMCPSVMSRRARCMTEKGTSILAPQSD